MAGTDQPTEADKHTGADRSIIYPGAMVYQGVGIRFIAILIDSVVLGAIFAVLTILMGLTLDYPVISMDFFQSWSTAFNLISLIVYIGYFALLEGTSGQTIGKLVMKIKVVKEDGTPCDLGSALIRNVLRIIDALVLYLVGAILIWRSAKKQRLGDMAAKTIVVKS